MTFTNFGVFTRTDSISNGDINEIVTRMMYDRGWHLPPKAALTPTARIQFVTCREREREIDRERHRERGREREGERKGERQRERETESCVQ